MLNTKKFIGIFIALVIVAGVIIALTTMRFDNSPREQQPPPPGMMAGGMGGNSMNGGPPPMGGPPINSGGYGMGGVPVNNAGENMGGDSMEDDEIKPGQQYINGPISEAKIQEFMEWTKQEDPERYQELMDMKSSNPQMFQQFLVGGLIQMDFVNSLKETDPAKYQQVKTEMKLERELKELTKKYSTADEKNKKEMEKKMSDILTQLFDIRTSHQERKIKVLQNKLDERKNNKSAIVQQRLYQITNRRQNLKW